MRRPLGASIFPLLIVGLLAALTFWLKHASELGVVTPGASRHDPDFYVEHFTIRRFGVTGELQHTLVAEKMLHYPDDDTSLITTPRLDYFEGPKTVVTARTAWLDKEGKHVRLNDDVRIDRAGENGALNTIITTSVLYVTPDDEYAETDAPVTITQGNSVVHGVGLKASNKTRIAVLSGPVHGVIVRNQNP